MWGIVEEDMTVNPKDDLKGLEDESWGVIFHWNIQMSWDLLAREDDNQQMRFLGFTFKWVETCKLAKMTTNKWGF